MAFETTPRYVGPHAHRTRSKAPTKSPCDVAHRVSRVDLDERLKSKARLAPLDEEVYADRAIRYGGPGSVSEPTNQARNPSVTESREGSGDVGGQAGFRRAEDMASVGPVSVDQHAEKHGFTAWRNDEPKICNPLELRLDPDGTLGERPQEPPLIFGAQ